MEKVTYGAPRYMDWVAQIKAGAATVKVHFTGGALTVYGVTPAEYTTTNPFIQKVIEQSKYFKEGRIVMLKRITIPDATATGKAKKAQKKPLTTPPPAPLPQPVETKAAETPEAPAPKDVKPVVEETADTDNIATEQDTTEASDAAPADNSLTPVEVSDLQDAQGYLQQNFNIASYKVRSRVSAQKAANEHGIMFFGGGFTPYGDIDGEENVATEE